MARYFIRECRAPGFCCEVVRDDTQEVAAQCSSTDIARVLAVRLTSRDQELSAALSAVGGGS